MEKEENANEDEDIRSIIYPSHIFGTLSTLSGKVRFYTVTVTSTQAVAFRFPLNEFNEKMKEFPDLEYSFCKFVAKKVASEILPDFKGVSETNVYIYI